jgi:dTDP-4-dehydrorhamnose 3,5-epimerase
LSRSEFLSTPLPGVVAVKRLPIADSRGFLARIFCGDEFRHLGLTKPIVQINHSFTRRRGVVRGMHFQHPPHAEAKIVACLHGEVFDVAVDLRADSPTFLRWHGEILSAANGMSLYVAEGFAHGFQTLTENCELLYLHTEAYAPESEGGVHPREPRIGVEWPLPIAELSPRDESHPLLDDGFAGVRL